MLTKVRFYCLFVWSLDELIALWALVPCVTVIQCIGLLLHAAKSSRRDCLAWIEFMQGDFIIVCPHEDGSLKLLSSDSFPDPATPFPMPLLWSFLSLSPSSLPLLL